MYDFSQMLTEGEGFQEEQVSLNHIELPPLELSALSFSLSDTKKKDIFAEKKRQGWDKTEEARCDLQHHLRLTRRSDINFTTIWQKSVLGRTLAEIKADDEMVPFFASEIIPTIKDMLGYNLSSGNWCICTTPRRRHLEKNFASRVSEMIGKELNIPFYMDVANCRSKQRVGAIFDMNNLPKETNIIVYDDFVTTGQTLKAMSNLLMQYNKNLAFFAGVNNKL